jgi:hypothetical protein
MPLSINPMLFLKTGFLAFWLIFEEVLLVAATNTAETLKDCSLSGTKGSAPNTCLTWISNTLLRNLLAAI